MSRKVQDLNRQAYSFHKRLFPPRICTTMHNSWRGSVMGTTKSTSSSMTLSQSFVWKQQRCLFLFWGQTSFYICLENCFISFLPADALFYQITRRWNRPENATFIKASTLVSDPDCRCSESTKIYYSKLWMTATRRVQDE